MKRFFFVFSILMFIFLVLMAGALAIAEYGAIDTYKPLPGFLQGWGVTLIPYHGSEVIYSNGDAFLIKQGSSQDVYVDKVVLFFVKDKKGIMSGYVSSGTEGLLSINGADGNRADVPISDIVGIYKNRIPYLGSILGTLRSPVAIGVLAAALIASILLWRLLPSAKPKFDGLSMSDSDIASILY